MSLLHQLAARGDISWLASHFAEFVAAQSGGDADDLVSLSAALVSEANEDGSACIELAAFHRRPLFDVDPALYPDLPVIDDIEAWESCLRDHPCVGVPGELQPLILDAGRLYLHRFWHYESSVATRIQNLLTASASDPPPSSDERLADSELDADQRQAVRIAARQRFSVVSGGPGSGKTSTVIQILTLLLSTAPESRISLAAPTGKAAARMLDSLLRGLDQADLPAAVHECMPRSATTLHRLLGYRGHRFEHDTRNPLPCDCVVVDEASMVDLRLMFHLLDALPAGARLILIGDRDQLASVSAGNVLGDITGHGLDHVEHMPPIGNAIALLRHNYRFGKDSAIGNLAQQINRGQSEAAMETLRVADTDVRWIDKDDETIDPNLLESVLLVYRQVLESATAEDALRIFATTRVLCATNRGPLGVDQMNQTITAALRPNRASDAALYHGLPIMILANQHELGLYNGDTGVLWREDGNLRACFPDAEGGLRRLALNRLPEYTPAWASSVHKSQGSEFDSVLLLLPSDPMAEVLSRELLYTAVTRARKRFSLQAPAAVVRAAIERLTRRHSGLAYRLGWPAGREPDDA